MSNIQAVDPLSNAEPSEQDSFSEMIAFHEKKDRNEFEINELATFFNNQYKNGQLKAEENEYGSSCCSSDDDIGTSMVTSYA